MSMNNLMPEGRYIGAAVTFKWKCAACGVLHEEYRACCPGDVILKPPSVPEGWTETVRAIYCPKHTITLLVDGRPEEVIRGDLRYGRWRSPAATPHIWSKFDLPDDWSREAVPPVFYCGPWRHDGVYRMSVVEFEGAYYRRIAP